MQQRQVAGKILMVFWANEYPMRRTIRDHLRAFSNHSGMKVYYINLRVRRRIPKYILRLQFDLIIYHTWFLATRWDRNRFPLIERACRPLKANPAVQIGFPQDEYVNIDHLEQFYNEYLDHVFTVAPLDQVAAIYPHVDQRRVHFHRVLTGYLDDEVILAGRRWHEQGRPKTIDIGYRSRPGYAYLGRFGLLKGEIARRFKKAREATDLRTDISTDINDTFLGTSWYRFLYSCKYTIGVEGGSHLLDPNGDLRQLIEEFQAEHPDADIDAIEAACFPGRDGEVHYVALSPRHLEACAMRTCQILIEGDYNGILRAGVHYIPLKPDFSNIEECIATVQRDDIRQKMVETAYRDVVESGNYTYKAFVDDVLSQVHPAQESFSPLDRKDRAAWSRLEIGNRILWLVRMVPFLLLVKFIGPFYKRFMEPHPPLRRGVRALKTIIFGRHS